MINVQVGDKIKRVMQGFRDEVWENDGVVIDVNDEVITCTVYVDVSRRMQFDRGTGISLLGHDYGRIEAAK